MQPHSPNPRIVRLTPLDTALDRLRMTVPLVGPVERAAAQAAGTVSAADIHAAAGLPMSPVAYADGWAVAADLLVGASAYSAAILSPPPQWVNAGDAMPGNADAVLPPDALSIVASGIAEASSSVSQGEGVRGTGQDVAAGAVIVAKGTRLTARHSTILLACGVDTILVRTPRVRIVVASKAVVRQSDIVRMWLEALGVGICDVVSAPGDRKQLAAAFSAPGADLVVSLGGTGEGREDFAVAALADAGQVDVHGIALRPGASAAFGQADGVPVLLLPGRVDAFLAGGLAIMMPAVALMSGLGQWERRIPAKLAGKVSSVIGFSEVFLGVPQGDAIQPVPLNEAGLDVLARAEGWFTVPPGSEGLAAGQVVQLNLFQPR